MRISSLRAKIILDSRNEETIEAEVILASGIIASASVPQGKSKGSREAVSLSATRACEIINEDISEILCDKEWKDAEEIDRALIALDGTQNKSRLGANTILAVSVAVARAQAKEEEVPLWEHLQERAKKSFVSLPFIFFNMIEGGLHSRSGLKIQEFWVIPKSTSPAVALEDGRVFYDALGEEILKISGEKEFGDEGGFAPLIHSEEGPFELFLSVAKKVKSRYGFDYGYDAAASNIKMSDEKLFELHKKIAEKYPVSFIEDPFGEEKFADFAKLKNLLGRDTIIAGDDLTVTNGPRIKEAVERGAINGVIIKPNQIGTFTEAISSALLAESLNCKVVVSHRSGETTDDWIADFAVGVGAFGVKFGAWNGKERVTKFSRLVQIEKECLNH